MLIPKKLDLALERGAEEFLCVLAGAREPETAMELLKPLMEEGSEGLLEAAQEYPWGEALDASLEAFACVLTGKKDPEAAWVVLEPRVRKALKKLQGFLERLERTYRRDRGRGKKKKKGRRRVRARGRAIF